MNFPEQSMSWGKAVLIFQAVVTLILGIAFFASILGQSTIETDSISSVHDSFSVFKERFQTASYVLVAVALIEIVIISRFI